MKKILTITGLSILGIVVIVTTSGFFIINRYLGKIHYDAGTATARQKVSAAADDRLTPDPDPSLVIDEDSKNNAQQVPESPKNETDKLAQTIRNNTESSEPEVNVCNVFNVLLVGIDTRVNSDLGNSDAMILISIDRKTSRIIETSILRDIYVNIPGQLHGNRLNASYALGGPTLLLKTIRENFKIQVDKYITVNFSAFIKIIDQLGGIDFDILSDEISVANDYIKEINMLEGAPPDDSFLTAPGMQHFTGKQVLGYVRIRYVGNNDFGRTDRQRLVIKCLFDKVKTLNLGQLDGFLNVLLPELRTNLDRGEIMSILLDLPKLASYRVESWYVPMDGTYTLLIAQGMDVLGIDFDQNISEMQKKIYGLKAE